MTPRLLVVIPVYGQHQVTHALLRDLRRERHLADVVVVDNKGDYPPVGWEQVLRPGSNLGWAGGSNHGVEVARRDRHQAVVWLNNDTRLSRGFLRHLSLAAAQSGAGVLSPVYDCHWLHQRTEGRPAPARYRGRRVHLEAAFVDGTCMFVPVTTIDRIGLLDTEAFGPLGWGAEIDYCLRARQAGLRVVITRAAFLHHARSVTAKAMFDDYDGYLQRAHPDSVGGLTAKWGLSWNQLAGVDTDTWQTVPLRELPVVQSGATRRRRVWAAVPLRRREP